MSSPFLVTDLTPRQLSELSALDAILIEGSNPDRLSWRDVSVAGHYHESLEQQFRAQSERVTAELQRVSELSGTYVLLDDGEYVLRTKYETHLNEGLYELQSAASHHVRMIKFWGDYQGFLHARMEKRTVSEAKKKVVHERLTRIAERSVRIASAQSANPGPDLKGLPPITQEDRRQLDPDDLELSVFEPDDLI